MLDGDSRDQLLAFIASADELCAATGGTAN
jgi:hypothetical protein